MNRFNWPLAMTVFAGLIFWLALILGLWNSIGCSTSNPC